MQRAFILIDIQLNSSAPFYRRDTLTVQSACIFIAWHGDGGFVLLFRGFNFGNEDIFCIYKRMYANVSVFVNYTIGIIAYTYLYVYYMIN